MAPKFVCLHGISISKRAPNRAPGITEETNMLGSLMKDEGAPNNLAEVLKKKFAGGPRAPPLRH